MNQDLRPSLTEALLLSAGIVAVIGEAFILIALLVTK